MVKGNKTLKFRLILQGGTVFVVKNVMSQLIFEMLEKVFQLSTSLEQFFKIYQNLKFTYE